jgi:hypothetical protein
MAPLVPLLRKRGFELSELPAGNFELVAYQGLLLKDSYWRWPQRRLAGNTIDLFVKVLASPSMRLCAKSLNHSKSS